MSVELYKVLTFAIFALFVGSASAQDTEMARKKCIEFGFQDKTVSHESCVKQLLQSMGRDVKPGPVIKSGSLPVPQAPTEAQKEEGFWTDAKSVGNKEAYEAYLNLYPNGRFAGLARASLSRLEPTMRPVQAMRAPGSMYKDCTDCPEMVVIPGGSFVMGSSSQEQLLANIAGVNAMVTARESPQHYVQLKSFSAGRFAVTKGEFSAFVLAKGYLTDAERGEGCFKYSGKEWQKDAGSNWRNVGFPQGADHPVVCISWNDAQAYSKWLSQTSGKAYRLLSEAEREYAARGGTQSAFWWGDNINTTIANYAGTSPSYNGSPMGEFRRATVPVNSFSPNPFGLFNVHGNVAEWVEDCYHETYNGAPADGSPWTTNCSGERRVMRGGSGINFAANLRSAFRFASSPNYGFFSYGFRVASSL